MAKFYGKKVAILEAKLDFHKTYLTLGLAGFVAFSIGIPGLVAPFRPIAYMSLFAFAAIVIVTARFYTKRHKELIDAIREKD